MFEKGWFTIVVNQPFLMKHRDVGMAQIVIKYILWPISPYFDFLI